MKRKVEDQFVEKTGRKSQHKVSKTRVRDLAHSIYQERINGGVTGDAESDWYKAEEELYR